MAKDLIAFLTRMKEDSVFTKEVEAKVKSIAEAGKLSDKRELLVKVGKELGYEFTVDDLDINVDVDQEMSDDELTKIAGGVSCKELLEEFFEWWAKTTLGPRPE